MTPERKRALDRAWYDTGYEELGIGFGRGSGFRHGAMPDRDYVHAHTYRASPARWLPHQRGYVGAAVHHRRLSARAAARLVYRTLEDVMTTFRVVHWIILGGTVAFALGTTWLSRRLEKLKGITYLTPLKGTK